jgi:hypothetical protein
LQAVELTATVVDSVLSAVLARPEFTPAPTSPLGRLLTAAGGWILERIHMALRWLLPDLDVSALQWGVIGRMAQPVLLVIGVLVLGYIVTIGVRAFRGRRRRRRGGAGDRPEPVTAADWEAAARAAADAGRWREAALALYQAVLRRLAQEGAVRFDPSRTPGEYRRELRSHPQLGDRVDRFVRAFERAAFGRSDADAAMYAELRQLAMELRGHG